MSHDNTAKLLYEMRSKYQNIEYLKNEMDRTEGEYKKAYILIIRKKLWDLNLLLRTLFESTNNSIENFCNLPVNV